MEALGTQRATLGDRHTDTLRSINNLAMLWKAQGKLAEAELLLVYALHALCDTLGYQHPVMYVYVLATWQFYGKPKVSRLRQRWFTRQTGAVMGEKW